MTAGKEVLFEIKPTVGFEELSYSAVFAHLAEHYDQKVTIGSVHERIWKSQREFQLDVLADALQGALPGVPDEAMSRAAHVLEQLDLSTPAQRRYAAQSAVRLSSYRHSKLEFSPEVELAHVVRFRLWKLEPDHPEAAGFMEAITRIRRASTDEYVAIVRQIMTIIGLRVRPDAGDPDEAVLSIALLGNAARIGIRTDTLEAAHAPRQLPSGPGGAMEEWHNDALALWSIVRGTLELDGDGLTDGERRL